MAAAHPGMNNLRHRYLLIPTGKDGADLLLLSATGTPEAFRANDRILQGIFASVKVGNNLG